MDQERIKWQQDQQKDKERRDQVKKEARLKA
jgi:hypothetical protein